MKTIYAAAAAALLLGLSACGSGGLSSEEKSACSKLQRDNNTGLTHLSRAARAHHGDITSADANTEIEDRDRIFDDVQSLAHGSKVRNVGLEMGYNLDFYEMYLAQEDPLSRNGEAEGRKLGKQLAAVCTGHRSE